MIQCAGCNRIIMDSTEGGGWKLRSRMIFFDENGEATALCPTCKAHVAVPVTLGHIDALPKTKLILDS